MQNPVSSDINSILCTTSGYRIEYNGMILKTGITKTRFTTISLP